MINVLLWGKVNVAILFCFDGIHILLWEMWLVLFICLFFSFCLYVVEEQKQFQSRIFRKIQAGQLMMHTYFVMRNLAFN